MTVQQAVIKWDVTPRQIQLWYKTGRLLGAQKWNRDWAIPENAETIDEAQKEIQQQNLIADTHFLSMLICYI